jgi:hypothetical protein
MVVPVASPTREREEIDAVHEHAGVAGGAE